MSYLLFKEVTFHQVIKDLILEFIKRVKSDNSKYKMQNDELKLDEV